MNLIPAHYCVGRIILEVSGPCSGVGWSSSRYVAAYGEYFELMLRYLFKQQSSANTVWHLACLGGTLGIYSTDQLMLLG